MRCYRVRAIRSDDQRCAGYADVPTKGRGLLCFFDYLLMGFPGRARPPPHGGLDVSARKSLSDFLVTGRITFVRLHKSSHPETRTRSPTHIRLRAHASLSTTQIRSARMAITPGFPPVSRLGSETPSLFSNRRAVWVGRSTPGRCWVGRRWRRPGSRPVRATDAVAPRRSTGTRPGTTMPQSRLGAIRVIMMMVSFGSCSREHIVLHPDQSRIWLKRIRPGTNMSVIRSVLIDIMMRIGRPVRGHSRLSMLSMICGRSVVTDELYPTGTRRE